MKNVRFLLGKPEEVGFVCRLILGIVLFLKLDVVFLVGGRGCLEK